MLISKSVPRVYITCGQSDVDDVLTLLPVRTLLTVFTFGVSDRHTPTSPISLLSYRLGSCSKYFPMTDPLFTVGA
jgi:hypothetical protein